jgi:hypothetical protein
VHVPLRRAEIAMTRELLDRARCGATHRQMRAERVAQHCGGRSADSHAGLSSCVFVVPEEARAGRNLLTSESKGSIIPTSSRRRVDIATGSRPRVSVVQLLTLINAKEPRPCARC